jgi:5-methylcytosine-specific restriction endonuclease McrA
MSALRGARWPQKYKSIETASVGDGINPKTGRKCKLHKCPNCGGTFPKGEMQADHIDPVVPIDKNWCNTYLGYDWNDVIKRLFCEIDGFRPLCKACHKKKTAEERTLRLTRSS